MSTVTILLPILGVVVGAILQYWLSSASQVRGRLLEARTKAYADYLASVSRKSRVSKSEEREYSAVLAAIAEAKYRICVYGSDTVITKLAEFEGSAAGTAEREMRSRFLRLCQAMRQDAGSTTVLNLDILYAAVHGFDQTDPAALNSQTPNNAAAVDP
jgi:hypothetical protein